MSSSQRGHGIGTSNDEDVSPILADRLEDNPFLLSESGASTFPVFRFSSVIIDWLSAATTMTSPPGKSAYLFADIRFGRYYPCEEEAWRHFFCSLLFDGRCITGMRDV